MQRLRYGKCIDAANIIFYQTLWLGIFVDGFVLIYFRRRDFDGSMFPTVSRSISDRVHGFSTSRGSRMTLSISLTVVCASSSAV